MVTILIVAANPLDTQRLRTDRESRDIVEVIRQARYGADFVVEQGLAVRVSDLQTLLLQHDPDILHFSGHGMESGQILLEDATGNAAAVPPEALRRLFGALQGRLRCVVLNSCYSEAQSAAIAENVESVIGMSAAVSETAATDFAIAFYRALAFGKDIQTAFQLGCAQVAMSEVAEVDVPKLLLRAGQGAPFVRSDAARGAPPTPPAAAGISQQIVISGDAHTGNISQIGSTTARDAGGA